MMNKCPYCDYPLSGTEKFCSNCGKPIPRVDTYAASGKESERYIADTYKEEAAAAIFDEAPVANMDLLPPIPTSSAQPPVLPPIPGKMGMPPVSPIPVPPLPKAPEPTPMAEFAHTEAPIQDNVPSLGKSKLPPVPPIPVPPLPKAAEPAPVAESTDTEAPVSGKVPAVEDVEKDVNVDESLPPEIPAPSSSDEPIVINEPEPEPCACNNHTLLEVDSSPDIHENSSRHIAEQVAHDMPDNSIEEDITMDMDTDEADSDTQFWAVDNAERKGGKKWLFVAVAVVVLAIGAVVAYLFWPFNHSESKPAPTTEQLSKAEPQPADTVSTSVQAIADSINANRPAGSNAMSLDKVSYLKNANQMEYLFTYAGSDVVSDYLAMMKSAMIEQLSKESWAKVLKQNSVTVKIVFYSPSGKFLGTTSISPSEY